jgi:hypothetical protein
MKSNGHGKQRREGLHGCTTQAPVPATLANVFDAVVLVHLIRTLGVPDETELEEAVMHPSILCSCCHAGSSARSALCGRERATD